MTMSHSMPRAGSPVESLVSVIVPTYNRPAPLKRALLSVFRQALPDHVQMEVLVVDNSADGSARAVVTGLEHPAAKTILRYISEPKPGVARARNTGLRHARGKWVAFLDDDMEASEGWIAALTKSLEVTGADAAFGPIIAKPEAGEPEDRLVQFFDRSIDRDNNVDITRLGAYLGTANSMFDRVRCGLTDDSFDIALDEIGGEDTLLLRKLALSERTFIWSKAAVASEWVPERRANWNYVARRRFLSGQIRTLVNHRLVPPRWMQILFYMSVGLIQTLTWFSLSVLQSPFDSTRATESRTRAWGGLGKLFWGRRFRPKLYGTGLVS